MHRPFDGPVTEPVSADRRPVVGPIAMLPDPDDGFADAVRAGGGILEPLSERTRGLVWLSTARAAELVDVLDTHPRIGWVQLPWAGVDAFAPSISARRATLFTSARGSFAEPVAEHALALTLALTRFLPRRIIATSWDDEQLGVSLFGRRVVIVGAGGIARQLIGLLEPFRTHIAVVRRGSAAVDGADETVGRDRLPDVLAAADIVILAAALTDETRGMIGATELSIMPRSAYLVNVARGGLIDTDALVAALAKGTIAGAALDVTDPEPLPDGHPLWSEPACIITPHVADTPQMTAPLLADRIRRNVAAFLGDGRFVGVVEPERGY